MKHLTTLSAREPGGHGRQSAPRRKHHARRLPDTTTPTASAVTLRLFGQPATLDALVAFIRAQDTQMRQAGCGVWQRSSVHASARASIYQQCRTDADFALYQAAWALVMSDGTVPTAEDAARLAWGGGAA
jgi:hypothetical protein